MQERIAQQLADAAVSALISEASLTPKPGLVDIESSGAHKDMDWALLVKSAKALHGTFYVIAKHSYGASINQTLRENIAAIGREGEAIMLEATGGVNTHKGAIWTLGLMTSVLANQGLAITAETLFRQCSKLASHQDQHYQANTPTKGMSIRKQHGTRGAREEAMEGFPTLVQVLATPIPNDFPDHNTYWLYRLLQLMAIVDDTCVISRSSIEGLKSLQTQANTILALGGAHTKEGSKAYQALCAYCLTHNLSPGGSADLLAGIMFLEKLGVINGTVKL